MTMPVPTGQPPSTVANTGQRPIYTHRTWMHEMADVLQPVAGILGDLRTMTETLTQVRPGRTQQQLVDGCEMGAEILLRSGLEFVKTIDDKYTDVHQAIQRAGGLREVTQDKRYHDRD